jgi:hypothetical protein
MTNKSKRSRVVVDRRGDLHARTMARKQGAREADEKALAEGRMTAEEIDRKNSFFRGRHLKLDLSSGGRLR